VHARNQFGGEALPIGRSDLLCVPSQKLTFAPSPSPCPTSSTVVQAGSWWQDSGIPVVQGDELWIRATGTWGDSVGSVGPDGRSSQIVSGPCEGIPQEDCFPLPGYPIDLLVGRVGETGIAFRIGSGAAGVIAGATGNLQLVINDRRDILWDNFGSLDVVVTVCRP
jgi:hypothetical protein